MRTSLLIAVAGAMLVVTSPSPRLPAIGRLATHAARARWPSRATG